MPYDPTKISYKITYDIITQYYNLGYGSNKINAAIRKKYI